MRLLSMTGLAVLVLLLVQRAGVELARSGLTRAVAAQGLRLEQGDFRLDLLRGLRVENLVLALPQGGDRQRLASLSEVRIDLDWSELLGGRAEIRQLRVRGATLELPAADLPLRLEGAHANLVVVGGRLHLLDFSARYHGLPVRAHGEVALAAAGGRAPGISSTLERQAPVLAQLERALQHLEFAPGAGGLELELTPGLRAGELRVAGNLRTGVVLAGSDAAMQQVDFVEMDGVWDGSRLELSHLLVQQGEHSLQGQLRGSPKSGQWQGALRSSLDLASLVRALEWQPPFAVELRGHPRLALEGEWQEGCADWRDGLVCHGELAGQDLRWGGQPLAELRCELAWQRGDFQLKELRWRNAGEEWAGEVRWQGREFVASVAGEGPAQPILAMLGRDNATARTLAQALQLSGQSTPARVEARLRGGSLDSEDWKIEARLEMVGSQSGSGRRSLRSLIMDEIPVYRIHGALARPRWDLVDAG